MAAEPADESLDGISLASPLAVEAREITMTFGATRALADVSLAVKYGASHALVGRNGAGKSTLVGVLTGLLKPDHGTVRFNGEPAPEPNERERWRERVACVYQYSTVIPTMSVGENLFLNAYPNVSRQFVSWRDIRSQGRRLLDEWGLKVDVDRPARDLTVGQRQLLEIARALRLGSRFIILDEPTAQLEAREIEHLFAQIRRMQETGVTFLYISHHLDEIYEICQDVTVLRDGVKVLTSQVAELSKDALVTAMVGVEYVNPAQLAVGAVGDDGAMPALEVEHLTIDGSCEDVTFSIAPGECVGLAGLAGSGVVQVADAIVGLARPDGGSVKISGVVLPPGRVDRAIGAGVGYVPEDRHARGFCRNLSVEENLTTSVLSRLGRGGFVDPRRRRERAAALVERTGIVASSPQQLTRELSGGNQQKTVMGRALASDPDVLVLVRPTAGVDIASKQTLLGGVVNSGLSILIVSDELDELMVCDRVIVMFGGRVTSEFEAGWDGGVLVSAIEGVQR